LIFVGALVARKRLDLALHALGRLKNRDWTFQVVGDGPERRKLEDLAGELGLESRVRFLGVLENQIGRARIAGADLLILPSHEDGWGAVINEALMAGTPAICSDACGAADLIRSPALGSVFRCGNVEHLASCLECFMEDLAAHRNSRLAVRKWANCIAGKSVADYLIRCVQWTADSTGDKPDAPWRQSDAPELGKGI
jgi:glycosyltransferase involved in cell wall biosynthesis